MIKKFLHVIFLAFFGMQPAFSQEFKTGICLSLLVKNEEAVIEKCLSSVKGIVDCIAVCDIGSQDRTLALIKQFAKENRIPLNIYEHSWIDFGQNRTLGFEVAQAMLENGGFSLSQSYVLILDADMVLYIPQSFHQRSLQAPAYLVAEKSETLCSYRYHPHLLQASLPWKSQGLFGKEWSCLEAAPSTKLKTWLIETKGDSALLSPMSSLSALKGVDQEPLLFYLAQAQRCSKNFQEAISLYKTRLEKGGDSEEIWFSKYMLGKCYEELGDWPQAIHWYLEAYQHSSTRTESLVKVATHYRLNGKNDLTHLFAKYGSLLPHADDQRIFDLPPETDYHFDEELSIASYYTRFKEDGYTALSNFVLRRNLPWHRKNQAYRNLIFYAQNLNTTRILPIDIPLPFIESGSQEKYRPANPSILKTKNGYLVNCRAVNYTQVGAKTFTCLDSSGIFRTKNFLIDYDMNWNRLSQQEIVENFERGRLQSCNVQGLEDCRLVAYQEEVWFSCTTSDTNPTGQRQISLCKLGDRGELSALIPLKGPNSNRCEKNWLPFVKEDHLYMIYAYQPFVIYEPDLKTGYCKTVVKYEPDHDFSPFRGSAAPIEFQEGYLVLVHEVLQQADLERVYFHRFLYLDQDFKITKVSKPFTFQHFGIEFCCSMVVDHQEKELILAVGIEDREAYLHFVDLKSVESLLYPLPEVMAK